MVLNFHEPTREFEKALSEYTKAPYVIALDSASNGLFISLMYEKEFGNWDNFNQKIEVPCRTYMSAVCEVINAGGMVAFKEVKGETLKGAYRLNPTRVIDSALRFTSNMYEPNTFMCISFTGAYKHFKLGKGGAVLTDNKHFYEWAKKYRNSGRGECSYHVDKFNQLGINAYMMPDIATRGLVLFNQFYDSQGNPKHNEDLELPYPDLSKFDIYNQKSEIHKLYEENKALKEKLNKYEDSNNR